MPPADIALVSERRYVGREPAPDDWYLRNILHDDRKPLERWLAEQDRYARREASHLLQTPLSHLNRADRLRRRIIFAPWVVLGYTLFAKGLILDGWPGWYYALQRTYAELLLSVRLADARLRNSTPDAESSNRNTPS